ncbi:MAG: BrnA antitoxin family protein [Rhodocyclaceae bacterium]|nr:BrnA antitoxin family protein [Rhodocyclaceae bacterium]
MNSKVDEFTAEDVAYVRSLDLKDKRWKTVDEMPLLKALQSNPKARAMYAPRKHIHTMLDADILAWLKAGGRCYQARLNAILRKAMQDGLAH